MKWSPDPSSYFYAHLSGTVSYRNRPISSQTWTVPCKFSTVVYRAKTNHLWKKRIFPWKNSTALFKKRADHILYHMNDWTKIFLQKMENISILVHDSKSTKRLKFLGGHHSIKCFVLCLIENDQYLPKRKRVYNDYECSLHLESTLHVIPFNSNDIRTHIEETGISLFFFIRIKE